MREAFDRISRNGRVVETSCGRIEYAMQGEGPPVLVVHGAGGGLDQGLAVAEQFLSRGFQVIAPSRFGYLGTPLPADAAPAAQADAYACLLNTLKIRKCPVVGISAGALSAVQFALRYPKRASALVLLVPAAWAPPSPIEAHEVAGKGFITDVVLRSDLAMWLSTKLARPAMFDFFGVPKELQSELTPAQSARVNKLMKSILPVSLRQEGILNDIVNHESRERYTLEEITTPTLVIDAADVGTYPGSKYTAENIPGARFLEFPTGGHLLLCHEEEVRSEVAGFLNRHTARLKKRPAAVE